MLNFRQHHSHPKKIGGGEGERPPREGKRTSGSAERRSKSTSAAAAQATAGVSAAAAEAAAAKENAEEIGSGGKSGEKSGGKQQSGSADSDEHGNYATRLANHVITVIWNNAKLIRPSSPFQNQDKDFSVK